MPVGCNGVAGAAAHLYGGLRFVAFSSIDVLASACLRLGAGILFSSTRAAIGFASHMEFIHFLGRKWATGHRFQVECVIAD